VPGFEAPVMLAYSARNRSASIRIPHVPNPKGRRIEVRFPDSTANPYLAFAAMMMAAWTAFKTRSTRRSYGQGSVRSAAEEDKKIRRSAMRWIWHLSTSTRIASSDRRRCVHQRRNRRLHRTQDAGSHASAYDHPPVEFDMYYSL